MSDSDPVPTRVVVGVSGSLGSLTALCRAAAEARLRGASLWPVLAWEPPGGELAARRSPASALMVGEWQRLARERLLAALDDVFGDDGPRVPMTALVVRGAPGRALVATADRESDVLVVGAGRRSALHRALAPSTSRYCLAHATCPVLAVPPSPLQSELAAVHRRNTWRRRLDSGDVLRGTKTLRPEA
ncbi:MULTISPECIES: universal stress protein [Streptomyces]|jgi:nucleotide-binding universal stress UspA family protein|uniref:Universal stress protein n=1 Tax=Streptomyces spinosisporus TaxID=2927582 RepID=A0ABS9XX81_9ACTN|nr:MULTISPECIES: universal stress protein [Streptomyces]MCI3246202.1 universal stress protein [Streptomyces spinosisporus]WUB39816.1 universal stress protein [Streptomyces sp. NBC_00588]